MILGVDISTSITGFAIVADGNLLYYDSIDLRKYKNFFKKAEVIKEKLTDIFEAYQCNNDDLVGGAAFPIEHIYIEQSLHMFMSGKSSAKVLSTLTRFNGIVSWMLYELFEIEPTYIAAATSRKQAGITGLRGKKAKEVVLQFLLDNEPAFHVEYTKHGNPKPESFDRADAIVVAKAGWVLEQKGKSQSTL
jgi:Holliday junction resolvasome RuvABC endonuclease subunit